MQQAGLNQVKARIVALRVELVDGVLKVSTKLNDSIVCVGDMNAVVLMS